ncbi:MAG: AAA family ATPase, partial [Bacillota bacterium]
MVEKLKQTIQSLQSLNSMYEKIMNEVDVGLHAVDETRKTIIYNKKMMQIESMDSKDVLNKNLME